MITIKEIKEAQAKKFENLDEGQLVEAYGTVNTFKKEFSGMEGEIKSEINNRFENNTGFDKSVQQTIEFASGDVLFSVQPKENKSYSLDMSEGDFFELLMSLGVDPSAYVDVKYTITQSSLNKAKNFGALPPAATIHIKETIQPSITFRSKKGDE